MLRSSPLQLIDHLGTVRAKLIDTYLKVSTLAYPFGWLERLGRRLIDNYCHSLELVHLYVAVKEPVARIIR